MLNGEDGIRLGDPAGLGVTFANTYSDLENDFYQLAQEKTQQSQVTCSLTFVRSAYSRYRQFINWCAAATELYLIYCPYGETGYYRRVKVDYLTKTELGHGKWLEVPAAFKCLTPWYVPVPVEIGLTARTGNITRFPFRFAADLHFGGDAAGDMSAQLAPAGHLPAAVLLRYHGAILDPTIRLVGATSGKVYGICDLTATLGASDTLELSTLHEDSHVKKIMADGQETNLLDALNLAYEPYFHLPTTEPTVLSVESAASFSGTASLLVYYYYRSV